MSNFLYIHHDLSGVPDVWKIGIAMTPYSAVRARQKFCWNQFSLQHLYFGSSFSVSYLESAVKRHFANRSGKVLKNFGSQTEMFNVPIDELLTFINQYVERHQLLVKKIDLVSDYTASNSKSCPFKIPSEDMAGYWCTAKVKEIFGDAQDPAQGFGGLNKIKYLTTFNQMFQIDD